MDMPVTLPPGRLRLATRPNVTGSPALTKTIGIADVAVFAARPEWIPPDRDDRSYLAANQVGS